MATTRGILGTKVGMTQLVNEDGRMVPVTVIQAGPCTVTQVKDVSRDGYGAVQLAYGEMRAGRANKPLAGHFAKAEAAPTRHLVELRTDDAAGYETGQVIRADVLSVGELVDVTGTSKGKGTAGVMKRHGFHGAPASHGTERKHRSPGSIGACAFPGHVFKGVRMAGRMGHERVTVLAMRLVRVDAERGLLLVRGAIPGPNGGLVMVRTSVRTPAPKGGDA